MKRPKVILTKKFVLTWDTVLLSASLILIYIFKINLFTSNFEVAKLLFCIFLGFVLSSLFWSLTQKYKSFKSESKWIYPKLDETWGLFEFPIIVAGAQEVFFRGILMTFFGPFLSSFVFSIYNFWPGKSSWTLILYGFLFGLISSFVYVSWQNIIYSIALHTAFHFFNKYNQK